MPQGMGGRWRLGGLMSAAAAATIVWGCTMTDDAGTASQAIQSSLLTPGFIDPIEQEPFAVWTRAGRTPSQLVVAYDDEIDTRGVLGKAISLDGITFTKCNLLAPCNGPIDTTRVPDAQSFMRHHTVAADGLGNVVYLTLADTDGDDSKAERVVAFLSTDGGTQFSTAFPINFEASDCGSGEQDLPHATFDYSTSPPTLWVVWRNNSTGNSFGGCLKRFFIRGSGSTAQLLPLGKAVTISGMDREDKIGGSQGGLEVQAGDGVVTVVYANSDEDDACPTGEHHGVAWGSVSTFDNGLSWVDNARIFHSDTWHSCLLTASGGPPSVQNTIRSFDFVRTQAGIEYAVIADTPQSVRLFMNPAAGTKGWVNGFGVTANPWFEWCPGTHETLGDPTSPTRNWRHVDDGPCDPPWFPAPKHGGVMLPTIAADGDARLAVGFEFFESVGQPPPVFNYLVLVNANPLQPFSPFDFTTPVSAGGSLNAPASIAIPQKTVVQPFGAYFDMIPRQPSPGGGLTTPGCSGTGDFNAFFVRASNTGTAQIEQREVRPQ